jgi:hypothetical protein
MVRYNRKQQAQTSSAGGKATRCKLCRCLREDANGIQTTLGWFCYTCVRIFRHETAGLDDEAEAGGAPP